MNNHLSVQTIFTPTTFVKKLVISLIFSLTTHTALAEDSHSSGRVTYEHVMNMHAALGPSQQAMKSLIPKEKKSQLSLVFSEHTYRIATIAANKGPALAINFDKGNSTIVDSSAALQTRIGEMVGFPYQMQSPVIALNNIELYDQSKVIEEQKVKRLTAKATINNKLRNVEIWYSPDLPSHFSPYPITGVPGAVMSMTIGDDYWRYTATSIKFEPVKNAEFDIPASHQKITQEQLEDLKAEAIDVLRRNGAKVLTSKG